MLIDQPPQTIDPRYAVTAYDFKLARLVYAPLVSVDNREELPQMELAESVEQPTPTEYVATLRKGARFADGRPVTAEDVRWTFDTARDPSTGSRLALRFRDAGLERIEVLDERRVKFVLTRPHAPFLTDLDVGVLARPLAPAGTPPRPTAATGQGAGAGATTAATTSRPLGAGAFQLESVDGDRWRFTPNPYYVFGRSPLRRLTVKVIRDDNSRLLALVGGSGDLTQNTVSPLLVDAVMQKERLKVSLAPSAVWSYVGLNCDDPILKDVRVRQAIAYAIDRRAIIDSKLGGRAHLATGMLPTFHWAYSADVPLYEHDPAKARALLDAAGYPDPDGPGPKPRFTLVYKSTSSRWRVALGQVLTAQLAEVGIEVDLRPYEFATFFADVKAGNYQLFMMQIPEVGEPDLYSNFFASDRIPTRENPDRGGNRVRFRSLELDRLLDEGRRAVRLEDRKRIYGEVQRLLARELPAIPLWHDDNVAVMNRRVVGFDLLPTAQFSSLARTRKE